jgi:hypothetical protein
MHPNLSVDYRQAKVGARRHRASTPACVYVYDGNGGCVCVWWGIYLFADQRANRHLQPTHFPRSHLSAPSSVSLCWANPLHIGSLAVCDFHPSVSGLSQARQLRKVHEWMRGPQTQDGRVFTGREEGTTDGTSRCCFSPPACPFHMRMRHRFNCAS